MDKVWGKNAVSTRPSVDVTLLEKGWASKEGVRTTPGYAWYNMVTAALLTIIEKADLTPDASKDDLLYNAIVKIAGGGTGTGTGTGGTSTGTGSKTAEMLLNGGKTIEIYPITGSKLGLKIDNIDFSNRWPIDIAGQAESAKTATSGGGSTGGTSISQDIGNAVTYRGVIPNSSVVDFDTVLTTGHYSVATPAAGVTTSHAPSTDSTDGYGNMITLGIGDATSPTKTLQYPIASQLYMGFGQGGGTLYHRTKNFNLNGYAPWKQVVDTDMLANSVVKTAWCLGPELYHDTPITTTKNYILSGNGNGDGFWMLAKEYLAAGYLADYQPNTPNVLGWLRLNNNNGIVWSGTATGIVNVAQGYIDFTQNGSIGAVLRAQDYLSVSDPRLKENMVPLTNVTSALENFKGYSFKWKDVDSNIELVRGTDAYGVNAEEVEKVYPHAVKLRVDGYKAVSYNALVPVLLMGLKEANERIKTLETTVSNQAEAIKAIQMKLDTLVNKPTNI